MINDRLQFRAWCEVPLEDDNGIKKTYGFYLYEINVYDEGKEIGFDENILSDNLSLTNFPDTVQGELQGHFTRNNCVISDNYYRYKKFKCIEQCIGIKDKNGKWIYEGDIVKAGAYVNPFRIEWKQERLRYATVWGNGQYDFIDSMGVVFPDRLEGVVIGNIHENPKLIGKEP